MTSASHLSSGSQSSRDRLLSDKSSFNKNKIQRQVNRQISSSNLSFRQLLSKSQVRVSALRADVKQLKQKRFSWLRQRQIRFKKKQIAALSSKNRYLRHSIEVEKKREQLLGYLGAQSTKTNRLLRSRLGLVNFRFFKAELKQYLARHFVVDLFKVALGSLLLTVSFVYFVNATGLLGIMPAGVAALARLAADLLPRGRPIDRNTWFFLSNLLLNCPLLIFAFVKTGIRFAFLSLTCMLFQNLYNLIIQTVWFLNTNYFQMLIDYLKFDQISQQSEPDHLLWLFVFALAGALFVGMGSSLVYRSNGSTGGTDLVSGYVQKQKQVSIGRVNFFANIVIFMIVFLIKTLTINDQDLKSYFNCPSDFTRARYQVRFFFGPSLFASLLFVFALAGLLNWFYPKYRYLLVTITTVHPFDVMAALCYRGFNSDIQKSTKLVFDTDHPQGIITQYLELRCSVVDLKETKKIIFLVDEQATIATTRLYSFRGSKLIDAFRH